MTYSRSPSIAKAERAGDERRAREELATQATSIESAIAAEVLTVLDKHREAWAGMSDDALAQQLEEWSMAPTTNRGDLLRYAALTIFLVAGLEVEGA